MASELGLGELVGLLRKWADVLDIPSGDFVNQDLLRAADALTSLIAERDGLSTVVDLIREEAAKSNAPFGRSDSLALDRIRSALSNITEAKNG